MLTHVNKQSGEILAPHLCNFKKTNPQVDIRIIVGQDDPRGRRYNWRNADKPLREWWKKNGRLIKTENVAVIEWDTLVNCQLPELPVGCDLVGKQVFREPKNQSGKWVRRRMSDPLWHQDNWYWWPDIPKLELSSDETAIGLISFGAFFMKKFVLDLICKPRWDHIYEKSIQNELRFPTIVSVEGGRVGEIKLPYVHHSEMNFCGKEEIYHPIKTQQQNY